jgi:hypothetical protein
MQLSDATAGGARAEAMHKVDLLQLKKLCFIRAAQPACIAGAIVLFSWVSLAAHIAKAASTSSTTSGTQTFPLRTHQPIYQNPFDLASGGASLTRATQEGSFFVNPSLPAFGHGLHRWVFARTQLHMGDAPARAAYDAYAKQGASKPVTEDLVQRALSSPVHLGHDTAFGYINRYISTAAFSNVRADLAVRKFGDAGIPQVRVRAYGVGGGGLGASFALGQFVAIGASSKYLEVAQAADNISIADVQDSKALASSLSGILKRGSGISNDGSVTFQLRSRRVDLRIAATVTDIGNTQLGSKLEPYRQAYNGGIGLTFHGRDHAAHCGADLRDVLAAYGEHWTFRSYAGCKVLFYEIVGIGGGLSQGYPTAGLILDLPMSRLEVGYYTREVGSQIGIEGRSIYIFALGFEL